MKSCPLCTKSLKVIAIGGRDRIACPSCDFVHWNNPKPVTATVVPMGSGIVLVKRKFEPFVNDWCLPGGFMEASEQPEEAAVREVFEETGLKVDISELLGAFSPGRGINVLILVYLASNGSGRMKAGDDASDVRIFQKGDLPGNIAFELHRRMISQFFERNGRGR